MRKRNGNRPFCLNSLRV